MIPDARKRLTAGLEDLKALKVCGGEEKVNVGCGR